MKMGLVTAIIPTFKRPLLLKRAILSVLNQTYPHFEIYVFDNASNDETKNVVLKLQQQDPRIKYFCHKENIGMIANYQFAYEKVSTPYFFFLSDDDLVLPHFLRTAMEGFEKYPESAFSAASTLIITEKDFCILNAPNVRWNQEGFLNNQKSLIQMIGNYPVPTTVLFHEKIKSRVKIDMQNSLFWDCDFLIQIAAQFPFYLTKKPCGFFLVHPDSYSNSRSFDEVKKAHERLIGRLDQYDLEPSLRNSCLELLNREYKTWTIHHFAFHLNQKRYADAFNIGQFIENRFSHTFRSQLVYFFLKLFRNNLKMLQFLRKIIVLHGYIKRRFFKKPSLNQEFIDEYQKLNNLIQ